MKFQNMPGKSERRKREWRRAAEYKFLDVLLACPGQVGEGKTEGKALREKEKIYAKKVDKSSIG